MTRAGFLVLLLLLSLSPRAGASDDIAPERLKAARGYYEDGTIAYEDGRYELALRLFERAYVRAPLPGFLFNIGQCHRQLGHDAEALDHYERYLVEDPEAPNRGEVEQLIADLQAGDANAASAAQPDGAGEPAAEPAEPLDPAVFLWIGGGAAVVAVTAAAIGGVVAAVAIATAPSLGRVDLREQPL